MLAPHPIEELQIAGPPCPGFQVVQLLVLGLDVCCCFPTGLQHKNKNIQVGALWLSGSQGIKGK